MVIQRSWGYPCDLSILLCQIDDHSLVAMAHFRFDSKVEQIECQVMASSLVSMLARKAADFG